MDNPFSWDYLTAPLSETPTFGPFSIIFLALMSFSFVASAYVSIDVNNRFPDHKLRRDTFRKGAQWLMWVSGFGLFFFLIRAMRFEFLTLHMRTWLYLTFLVWIALIAYFVYYMRTVYPVRLAEFERGRERRKWATTPASRRASRPRGSQRKRKTAR